MKAVRRSVGDRCDRDDDDDDDDDNNNDCAAATDAADENGGDDCAAAALSISSRTVATSCTDTPIGRSNSRWVNWTNASSSVRPRVVVCSHEGVG